MEAVHGHVELVAVRVLEREEFSRHAVDVECRQASIPADAVLLMDDWCANAQVRELAHDRVGVPRGTASTPALPWLLETQPLGGHDAQFSCRQAQAFLEVTRRNAQWRIRA